MGRRHSSGLFETLFKSAFGFGSTVKYETSFWGHKRKVVTYHDTGKKKTYSHGHGILGNVTKTTTKVGGRTVERGTLRSNLLWGATEHATRTDGSRVKRSYTPGIFRDHVSTRISGECWKCSGAGNVKLSCRNCNGTGTFHLQAKRCRECDGLGISNGYECRPCHGTGEYRRATAVRCRRCEGTGKISPTCAKCGGSGAYTSGHYR